MHVNRSDHVVTVDEEMQSPQGHSKLKQQNNNDDLENGEFQQLKPWDPDKVDEEQLKEIYKKNGNEQLGAVEDD